MNEHPDHRKATFKPKDCPGLGDDISCSKCGAVALDTGLECDNCGHDMAPEICCDTKPAAPSTARAEPTLRERLQRRCTEWGAYWRASDAHGVQLSHEQALELLRDALAVEVEIAPAPSQAQAGGVREALAELQGMWDFIDREKIAHPKMMRDWSTALTTVEDALKPSVEFDDFEVRAKTGDELDAILREKAALSTPSPEAREPQGEVVITTNEHGAIVGVTRQDEEGRVLKVLAEARETAEPVVDADDFKLPFDVTIGHGTHKKGTKFSSLMKRMQLLYGMTHAAPPAVEKPAELVALVPVHPRMGPLWSETYPAADDVTERRAQSYPLMALYAAPVSQTSEVERLRGLAATCYAGLGAECNLPEQWLDTLNAAANGEPFSTEGLLPFTLSVQPSAQEPK